MYFVKSKREEKGLSQEELARLSGVSRATISMLETNTTAKTSTTTLIKIARALDCRVADIFLV